MRKFISAYFIVITILGYMYISVDAKGMKTEEKMVVIPNDAIRLRILANSDTESDQFVKKQVSSKVNEHISAWGNMQNNESARKEIKSRLSELEKVVADELTQLQVNTEFTVEFKKVEFPTKMYGNFLYTAGYYEAILITLGKGEGRNWWCVLYPQVCFVNETNNDMFHSTSVFAKEIEATNQAESTEEELLLNEESEEIADENQLVIIDEEKTEEVEVRFFLLDLFFK